MKDNRLHPYKELPPKAFWNRSVSDRHFLDLEHLWDGMPLRKADRVATAGSCFAQHLGHNLARRGANFMNLEPAPTILQSEQEARKYGYGVFSCRYGNIYTTRQLLQLYQEAFEGRRPNDLIWERSGRFFDAMRPAVDPVGQADENTVRQMRVRHLDRVREMFETLDVLVMTLGLTEAWVATEDGTVYPTAPGTIAGKYDSSKYHFSNFTYPEISHDMRVFWDGLKKVNPGARMLLTVSPVPLQATASENHVMVATCYSKSVLRAVAGDLVKQLTDVYYFPSYEIITASPGRGMFYDPDWRNVNQHGVDYVMHHFFNGALAAEFSGEPEPASDFDVVCDEEAMHKSIA